MPVNNCIAAIELARGTLHRRADPKRSGQGGCRHQHFGAGNSYTAQPRPGVRGGSDGLLSSDLFIARLQVRNSCSSYRRYLGDT